MIVIVLGLLRHVFKGYRPVMFVCSWLFKHYPHKFYDVLAYEFINRADYDHLQNELKSLRNIVTLPKEAQQLKRAKAQTLQLREDTSTAKPFDKLPKVNGQRYPWIQNGKLCSISYVDWLESQNLDRAKVKRTYYHWSRKANKWVADKDDHNKPVSEILWIDKIDYAPNGKDVNEWQGYKDELADLDIQETKQPKTAESLVQNELFAVEN